MSEEEFKNKLQALFDEYGKTLHKDGAFCTTYFVTSEFFDGSGEYWASTFYSDSPIWRISGLVQHALDNDLQDEEDFDEEED